MMNWTRAMRDVHKTCRAAKGVLQMDTDIHRDAPCYAKNLCERALFLYTEKKNMCTCTRVLSHASAVFFCS
jgi:hypothetical protein